MRRTEEAADASTPPGREPDTWAARLRGEGHVRNAALAELHALLVKGARFVVFDRRSSLPGASARELEEIAVEAADDALLAILRRLGDFRGESRFTTWAYKFAFLEAAAATRRRAWKRREIPHEDADLAALVEPPDGAATPEQRELAAALRDGVERLLTPHQRLVFVAACVQGVPIDVLAERLGSTRGALYKTIHDARRKLRAHLVAAGFRSAVSDGEPPVGGADADLTDGAALRPGALPA